MLAECAERIKHRAHLLADRAQRAGQDLELDRVDHRAPPQLDRARSVHAPDQPAGTSSVDSGSSITAGADDLVARSR